MEILKFLKFFLLKFECISILLTIKSLLYLFGYIFIFRFTFNYDINNFIVARINYDYKINPSVYSDLEFNISQIKLYEEPKFTHNETNQAYIILNNHFVKKMQNKDTLIMEYLNRKKKVSKCFFFNDPLAISQAKGVISNYYHFTTDIWNMMISGTIILFIFFMKYNISTTNVRDILQSNKRYYIPFIHKQKLIYSYFILHLSTIIILSELHRSYDDLKFNGCFGFGVNYFYSYYYNRTLLSKNSGLDFVSDDILKEKQFIAHPPLKNFAKFNYRDNMLFLCVIVWISGMFMSKYFDKDDGSLRVNKKKKVYEYTKWILVIVPWLYLLFKALLTVYDDFLFYHILIFNNALKILDVSVFIYLLLAYYHILFYCFIIYYLIKARIKNDKFNYYEEQSQKLVKKPTITSLVDDESKKSNLKYLDTTKKDFQDDPYKSIRFDNDLDNINS